MGERDLSLLPGLLRLAATESKQALIGRSAVVPLQEKRFVKHTFWRVKDWMRPADRDGELYDYPEFAAQLLHYNCWAYTCGTSA